MDVVLSRFAYSLPEIGIPGCRSQGLIRTLTLWPKVFRERATLRTVWNLHLTESLLRSVDSLEFYEALVGEKHTVSRKAWGSSGDGWEGLPKEDLQHYTGLRTLGDAIAVTD